MFLKKPGTGSGTEYGLKNSVVFTWGFVEVVGWFWVSGGFFFHLFSFSKKKYGKRERKG